MNFELPNFPECSMYALVTLCGDLSNDIDRAVSFVSRFFTSKKCIIVVLQFRAQRAPLMAIT